MCLPSFTKQIYAFTSGFLGEILTGFDVASRLTFFSWFSEVMGSVLGEIFICVGKLVILLCCSSSLSSSLFFIEASLELVLTGAGLFLGDVPLTL